MPAGNAYAIHFLDFNSLGNGALILRTASSATLFIITQSVPRGDDSVKRSRAHYLRMVSNSSPPGSSREVKLRNPKPRPSSSPITRITSEAMCKVCQTLVDDILNDNVVGNPEWSAQKDRKIWTIKHHAHSDALIHSSRKCWLCQIILLEIAISLPMAYAIKKSAFSRAFGVGTPSGSERERIFPATNFTFRETWDLNSLLDLRAPLSHYPSYEPDGEDGWGEGPLTDMSWLGKSVAGSATSPICYALARRWLNDCLRSPNHSQC